MSSLRGKPVSVARPAPHPPYLSGRPDGLTAQEREPSPERKTRRVYRSGERIRRVYRSGDTEPDGFSAQVGGVGRWTRDGDGFSAQGRHLLDPLKH